MQMFEGKTFGKSCKALPFLLVCRFLLTRISSSSMRTLFFEAPSKTCTYCATFAKISSVNLHKGKYQHPRPTGHKFTEVNGTQSRSHHFGFCNGCLTIFHQLFTPASTRAPTMCQALFMSSEQADSRPLEEKICNKQLSKMYSM